MIVQVVALGLDGRTAHTPIMHVHHTTSLRSHNPSPIAPPSFPPYVSFLSSPPQPMRSRFRRPERVFAVDLHVHQLDHIPSIPRLFYIHWRAKRAIPYEGRTPSLSVSPGNVIRFNSRISFSVTIPSAPTDPALLQPAPLIIQLRSERKGRWLASASFQAEGKVTIDLAEVAATAFVARNYLVQDSLLNTTLNLSIRVTLQSGDRIFRTGQLDLEGDESVSTDDAPLANSTPQLQSFPSASRTSCLGAAPKSTTGIPAPGMSSAATMPNMSTFSGLYTSNDREAHASSSQNPSVVLENSIPNPEVVQRRVYERMFQEQVRDAWPDYIVQSRVDAMETVDALYARVCAEDGIGVAAGTEGGDLLERADKTMSVEALIESRNGVVGSAGGAAAIQRKQSEKSSRLSVRSSSMGELPLLRI